MKSEFGTKGWTPERLGSLNGKSYVITGANAGAGFEATKILLSKGAEVVMLNRNEKKSNKAIADLKEQFGADASVSFVRMDLAELSSVRSAAKEVLHVVFKLNRFQSHFISFARHYYNSSFALLHLVKQ